MNINEVRMNKHQEHIEDLVLFGVEGLEELNDHIESFINKVNGGEDDGINVTQKIDGAPAVFVGHNVPGYPEVCVGIKSFLTDTKNAYSTDEEIDALGKGYGNKLKFALKMAEYIPDGQVWQGDCLFTSENKKLREIKGKEYLTFRANKLIYAFSSDNDSYESVDNAEFGIAFHTVYTKNGDEWNQSFRVPEVKFPSQFYVLRPSLKMSNERADYNLDEVESQYEELLTLENQLTSDQAYEDLINNDTFLNQFKIFKNQNTSDKKINKLDIDKFFDELKDFCYSRKNDEHTKRLSKIDMMKVSDASKEKKRSEENTKYDSDINELNSLLGDNKLLNLIVKTVNIAADIKLNLLSGLNKTKQDYSTYYKRSSTGEYVDSNGEGISLSDAGGNIVKLVDRSEFSNINRDPDVESEFSHESLEEEIGDLGMDIEATEVKFTNTDDVAEHLYDLIDDELEAIDGYNKFEQTFDNTNYGDIISVIEKIKKDEEEHAKELVDLLDSKSTIDESLLNEAEVVGQANAEKFLNYLNSQGAKNGTFAEEDFEVERVEDRHYSMINFESAADHGFIKFYDNGGILFSMEPYDTDDETEPKQYEEFSNWEEFRAYLQDGHWFWTGDWGSEIPENLGEAKHLGSCDSNTENLNEAGFFGFGKNKQSNQQTPEAIFSELRSGKYSKEQLKQALNQITAKYHAGDVMSGGYGWLPENQFKYTNQFGDVVLCNFGGSIGNTPVTFSAGGTYDTVVGNAYLLDTDEDGNHAPVVLDLTKPGKIVKKISPEEAASISKNTKFDKNYDAQQKYKADQAAYQRAAKEDEFRKMKYYHDSIPNSSNRPFVTKTMHDVEYGESLAEAALNDDNQLAEKQSKQFMDYLESHDVKSGGAADQEPEIKTNPDGSKTIYMYSQWSKVWVTFFTDGSIKYKEDAPEEDYHPNETFENWSAFVTWLRDGHWYWGEDQGRDLPESIDECTLIESGVKGLNDEDPIVKSAFKYGQYFDDYGRKLSTQEAYNMANDALEEYYDESPNITTPFEGTDFNDEYHAWLESEQGTACRNLQDEDFSNFWENWLDENIANYFEESLEKKTKITESAGKSAVVCFGRFNPATIGHKAMFEYMSSLGDSYIYTSHSQDPVENPLPYDRKVYWLKKLGVNIVESEFRDMYEMLKDYDERGFKNIIYVCGSDRLDDANAINHYSKAYVEERKKALAELSSQYDLNDKKQLKEFKEIVKEKMPEYAYNWKNTVLYHFDSFEVKQAGAIREGVTISQASGSKAREFVRQNDFENFKQIVPFEEEDAKKLFLELKSCMGINEGLNFRDKRHLSRLLEAWKAPDDYLHLQSLLLQQLNGLKVRIKSKPGDLEHKQDGEVLRIFASPEVSESTIQNHIKDAINNISSSEFDCKYINYQKNPEVSGTYKSVKISVGNNNYYVVIANKAKKVFTPNKVLKVALDAWESYSNVKFDATKLNGLPLDAIYTSAVQNPDKGDAIEFVKELFSNGSPKEAHFSATFDKNLAEKIPADFISDIKNDFGEILSAGCLASILGPNGELYFPKASNEPLIDFKVREKAGSDIKVSQKAGKGASPSSTDIIVTLYNNLDKELKGCDEQLKGFITWMYDNVASQSVSIDAGFRALSRLVCNALNGESPDWFTLSTLNSYDTLKKYTKERCIKVGSTLNINEFLNEIRGIVGTINTQPLPQKAFKNVDDYNEYLELLRVRFMARLAIMYFNSESSGIITKFNEAITKVNGKFVQVYLESSDEDIKNGSLKFRMVTTGESSGKFIFNDSSQLDIKTLKMSMKKLSCKIVSSKKEH